MAGACGCESCRGKACGRVWRVWGRATAGLNALKNRWLGRVAARVAVERPAEGFGACNSCESCRGKACGRVWRANRWLGRVAARVPVERRAEGLGGGFEGGQTAGLNALNNRWLGRVAARVAVERLVEGFGGFAGFEGGQTAGLNALKNRWLGRGCRGKACVREGLRAGKRQV